MTESREGGRQGFAVDAGFIGFAVIWQSLGAVERALADLCEARRHDAQEGGSTYHLERGPCDLARVSFGKPLYSPDPTEVCIYRPACSPFWSVWVANAQDGWGTLLNWLCEHGQWAAVSVRSTQAGAAGWVQELQLREGAKTSRLVRAMWDGRPEFFAAGEPLFCEEPELYAARSVRARLTRAALGRYLGRLGLPVSLPGFWASGEEATYFRRCHPVPASRSAG